MSSILSQRRPVRSPARLLTFYVMLHPFIDILTFLGVQAEMFVTVGNAVRTVFLAAAVLYILRCGSFEGRGPLLLYLGAATAYLMGFCVLHLAAGGLYGGAQNLMESIKVFYFPYMAAFLYALYKKEGFVVPDWPMAAAGAGYCVVILLAYLTGTSYISYNAGYGYCGWFFSANDVSSMILLTAPLLLYLCTRCFAAEKRPWALLLAGFLSLALVFSAAFIGTKLLYLGVLAYLACALVWLGVRFFRKRDKPLLKSTAFTLALCAVLLGLYPVSPLNQYIQDIYIPMSGDDPAAFEASQQIAGIIEVDRAKAFREYEEAAEGTWLGNRIDSSRFLQRADWILSRRLTMLAPVLEEYTRAGLGEKLLGMGYVYLEDGHRLDISHMIEMEGPSMLLRHGLIGFALYYLPFLAASAYLIYKFLRRLGRNIQDLRYCSLFYSVLMAFAASMAIGHVLAPPCTSLMAALLYEKLLLRSQEEEPDIFTAAQKRAGR